MGTMAESVTPRDSGASLTTRLVWGALLAWAGVTVAARIAEPALPELVQLAARSKL